MMTSVKGLSALCAASHHCNEYVKHLHILHVLSWTTRSTVDLLRQ